MNNNKSTFRSKVKSKFNSQVTKPQAPPKEKETIKSIFVLTFSPLILAKSQKEVNEISKYFKKNNNSPQKKSYTQASSSFKQTTTASISSITRDMLKLKEMFSNFPNKKIDLVQKVINGLNNMPKPRINMTMKGFSYKQVIIPMNSKLSKKFIKDSSMHVININ